MWIGWVQFDILLGNIHSLKEKRSVLRPLLNQIRRKFGVSVAEVDHQDLYRRAEVGTGIVAADRSHVVEVLAAVENLVASQPDIELLSSRQRVFTSDD